MIQILIQILPELINLKIIMFTALGVAIGASFGAIPGLSGILAIALILPYTFNLGIYPSMAILLGAYKGSMFGGSVSAISFGVPGDSPAAATVIDGWPLTKQGKPYRALNAALYGSIFGNFFADLVVLASILPLSVLALKFGPRELTILMILAMLSLTLLLGKNVGRGLLGVMIGGFIATFGFDPVTAIPRLTFGTRTLLDGIPLVPFIVGLFAFSEILIQYGKAIQNSVLAGEENKMVSAVKKRLPDDNFTCTELLTKCWPETLIGSIIGVILGAIPGPGATMAAFSSYGICGRLKKNRGKFGTGVAEGVVAAEVANSATVGPTLIPLFTFGVPGSGIAALFGAALILQGMTPGPGLFTDHMNLIAAVFILMPIGTLINLLISKILIIPVFTKLAFIEARLLTAWLVPLMMIGIYAMNLRPFDVVVFFIAGFFGLILRRIRVPLAPVVVAMIVAPLLEVHLRRALILSRGNLSYFVQSPISIILYLILLALAIFSWRTAEKNK